MATRQPASGTSSRQAGQLYLEIHPAGDEVDEVEGTGRFVAGPISALAELIRKAAGARESQIDRHAVETTDKEQPGIRVQITSNAAGYAGILPGR